MGLIWTDYIKYKARSREFDLVKIEGIVRYSTERYFDTETGRQIAIGYHDNQLVMIPYEVHQDSVIPITVHATTRQQIRYRIRTGRYTLE